MIDMLPDNVLLEIFDFYREDTTFCIDEGMIFTWRWKALIHVCRRWRCVIFGSPRRLDLRVVCTDSTPTMTLLDVWPPFPISIASGAEVNEKSVENIIAAVEHGHDRISHFSIEFITGPALGKLAAAMQQPLPTLKHFRLTSYDDAVPVLPEKFLGGSAPLLETFISRGIPLPTLPKTVLSFTHLQYLHINNINIPHSGYISPNAMVACLPALPNLDHLYIAFRSGPPQITPPPRSRIVLPALIRLFFCGVCEYLEDFVAQIDTPLLNHLDVTFFMDDLAFFMDPSFDIPQFRNFIGRAERLKPLDQATMSFDNRAIWISDTEGFPQRFRLEVQVERPDWQLSSMVQIFGQQLRLLSHVEQLEISHPYYATIEWIDNPYMLVDTSLWLELFHLFIALRRLYVSKELVAPVAATLQQLTEGRTMEVLPALHSLFLEGLEPPGPVPEGIKLFVAARQLSDQPVAVQGWKRP
jgi:hypothetical protein